MQVIGEGGYQETLDALKELHRPILHIVKSQGARMTREAIELLDRFDDLSYEIRSKPASDDDMPF